MYDFFFSKYKQDYENDDDFISCYENASRILSNCLLDCDEDVSCISFCNRNFQEQYNNCPCQESYIKNAPQLQETWWFSQTIRHTYRNPTIIKNYIFIMEKENCPNGCPCANYECKSMWAILVLDNSSVNNLPVVINLEGKSCLNQGSPRAGFLSARHGLKIFTRFYQL